MCMYVSVFNNGVVLEGNGRETSGSNFELFWVAVGFSKIRTIKFLFVKKKQNLMDHSFFYAQSIGAENVTYGSNWCNK